MQRRLNLLLHHYPRFIYRRDVAGMAERIARMTNDIAVTVLRTDRPHPLAMLARALRPTVSVELSRARYFRCLRGKVLHHRGSGGKANQYRLLEAAGIPIPRWQMIEEGTKLDPAEWGPYVVVKPNRGRRGAYVRIARTGRVRHARDDTLPADHPGRGGGMLAQQFIYTGPWPIAFRVSTLFGTPLLSMRYHGRADLPAVTERFAFKEAGGASIVANAQGCRIGLADDPDVLDLARRVHAVFPEVPSLGIDIVRDHDTGRLFVLETNPAGNSWALGSPGGDRIMAENGIDLYAQFGALDRAAETLVDVTRRWAQ